MLESWSGVQLWVLHCFASYKPQITPKNKAADSSHHVLCQLVTATSRVHVASRGLSFPADTDKRTARRNRAKHGQTNQQQRNEKDTTTDDRRRKNDNSSQQPTILSVHNQRGSESKIQESIEFKLSTR